MASFRIINTFLEIWKNAGTAYLLEGIEYNAIFVSSQDGNDTGGQGTLYNPYGTISFALSQLSRDGQVIVIFPGTYEDDLDSPDIEYSCILAFDENTFIVSDSNIALKPAAGKTVTVIGKGEFISTSSFGLINSGNGFMRIEGATLIQSELICVKGCYVIKNVDVIRSSGPAGKCILIDGSLNSPGLPIVITDINEMISVDDAIRIVESAPQNQPYFISNLKRVESTDDDADALQIFSFTTGPTLEITVSKCLFITDLPNPGPGQATISFGANTTMTINNCKIVSSFDSIAVQTGGECILYNTVMEITNPAHTTSVRGGGSIGTNGSSSSKPFSGGLTVLYGTLFVDSDVKIF